jgi:signal transduction histidine kinase
MTTLIEMAINSSRDIVLVRQQAKRAAEAFSLASQDQTRFATAVSEVVREVVSTQRTGHMQLELDEARTPPLLLARIKVADSAEPSLSTKSDALIAARRLVDHFEFLPQADESIVIELGKRSPTRDRAVATGEVKTLLRDQARGPDEDLSVAFTDQNRELAASLQELQDKQQELHRLNQELQDTNRGVVALYAELEEKAEQLRAASEAKSKFLANVSHEFRTPLNSILALSRLLLDRVDGGLETEQEKQVAFIRRSADTLLEFVNDLLDLAKVESGKVDLRPTEFLLRDFLRGLRGVLKPLRDGGTVELVFEECDPIAVIGDEGKLGQILRNLVSNALKFTERGEVRVSVDIDPGHGQATFTVRDTGIGIAPDDQLRIFEEFEQVAGTLQQKNKGSGLGLALSRRLARLMGGEISVQSTPGRGSTFRVLVPLGFPRSEHRFGSKAGEGRVRVMVIDDEETFRYIVRHIVAGESDYELLEAENGEEGLRLVGRSPPDIMILDLQMPVMSGQEVLAALAANPQTRDIPVIVSTSLPITSSLQEQLPNVAQLFSKTDLSRDTLLDALRRCLAPAGDTRMASSQPPALSKNW